MIWYLGPLRLISEGRTGDDHLVVPVGVAEEPLGAADVDAESYPTVTAALSSTWRPVTER